MREVAVPPKSSVDAASFCGLFLYFVIPSHCLFFRMIVWTMTRMQKSSLALTCAHFNLARVRGSIILTFHSTVEIPSLEIYLRANLIAERRVIFVAKHLSIIIYPCLQSEMLVHLDHLAHHWPGHL